MSRTDAGGVDKLSERKLSCRELARYIWDRAQNSPACFEQDIARLIENERKRAVERSTPVRCDAVTAGLKEATAAQHFDLPKGSPAKFVRNGILETCQCIDCHSLASPPPSGVQEAQQTLWGMIAAIYKGADAEDSDWVDREWAKMRGLDISPTPAVKP